MHLKIKYKRSAIKQISGDSENYWSGSVPFGVFMLMPMFEFCLIFLIFTLVHIDILVATGLGSSLMARPEQLPCD